jgi:hypothetical protein
VLLVTNEFLEREIEEKAGVTDIASRALRQPWGTLAVPD